MFNRILIANRGEIAVRIIRACKEMGIETVAVYSEADADALHTALADERICIGPASAKDSYLREDRIISAALASGARAIHPGYGFLAENSHFAALCRRNGLVFIGPDSAIMDELADKARTKGRMAALGLPVIPGSGPVNSVEEALREADRIGYPVMLKARSGGGGKGIRLVSNDTELPQAYALSSAEAARAFSDSLIYIEKYVWPARHIEVQIIADEDGNVVCLGERDCSIQRNHQKLIEESPSPAVTSAQRRKLCSLVRAAVKKLHYTGVGTLEFLMDTADHIWFMEMNVRLQVEHGVTEMLTDIDLVKWQIRTAAGISLRYTQKDIVVDGCSVECRINALSPGRVETLHVPGGPGVRFDTALTQGMEVTSFYDSLIGKLIVYAHTREEAIRKLRAALCELVIDGVRTNLDEQLQAVSDPGFIDGTYDLTFMEGVSCRC